MERKQGLIAILIIVAIAGTYFVVLNMQRASIIGAAVVGEKENLAGGATALTKVDLPGSYDEIRCEVRAMKQDSVEGFTGTGMCGGQGCVSVIRQQTESYYASRNIYCNGLQIENQKTEVLSCDEILTHPDDEYGVCENNGEVYDEPLGGDVYLSQARYFIQCCYIE